MVDSEEVELSIEYLKDDQWSLFKSSVVSPLKPYEKTIIRMEDKNTGEREETMQVCVALKQNGKILETLEGGAILR